MPGSENFGLSLSRESGSQLRLLNHSDAPFREITRVDELNWIGRISGGENFASFINSHGPVGEAIREITGADNQSGANDRRLAGKSFLRFFLCKRFESAVGL